MHPVEHELKFIVPELMATALIRVIAARCLPDPVYPAATVSSIYFDTPGLRLLREKVDSDYLKLKVRARWYGPVQDGEPRGPAFLEAKRKRGGRRFKRRIESPWDAARLASTPLHDSAFLRLLTPLYESGERLPRDLRPLLQVSFIRQRFVEPISGARVSVDRSIRAPRVNRGRLGPGSAARLAHAVLEVKGPFERPPAFIDAARTLGAHRESFSKYLRCYQRAAGRLSL